MTVSPHGRRAMTVSKALAAGLLVALVAASWAALALYVMSGGF